MHCMACGKSLVDAEPTSIGVIMSIKDDRGTYHSACWGHSFPDRIAELEAALAFYSAPASYCKIYGFKSDDPRGFAPVLTDDGQRARAALAKT